MHKKIHVILPLFAASIIGIISFIQKDTLYDMCLKLVATIILFYILGLLAHIYLQKILVQSQIDISAEMNDQEEEEENNQ